MRTTFFVLFALLTGYQFAISQSFDTLPFTPEGRYPEGVVYHPSQQAFYVTSLKHGTVGKLSTDNKYQVFSDDSALVSSAGIQIDVVRNRLLVVVHDDGASVRSRPQTKHHLARLVVFDLATQQKAFALELNDLVEGRSHGNDIILDEVGNAYITDSFQPVIYRVTPEGEASIFLRDEAFRKRDQETTKPALNGIAYHPDGFLMATDYEKGKLWRIPLSEPQSFVEVQLPEKLRGADGIHLLGRDQLAVARTFNDSTQTFTHQVDVLRSPDGWQSATIVEQHQHPSLNCPTTIELVDSTMHVTNSHFKELFESPESAHDTEQFVLTKITPSQ